MRAALLLVGLAALGACTFPDVDYADGGAGAGSSSSSTSTGGSCPGLQPCTAAAASCASKADGVWWSCKSQCHGAGCSKCDTDHTNALITCAGDCRDKCAPVGCAGAAAACQTAAEL